MRLYLDDDTASQRLLGVLRQAGHDVEAPRDAQLAGKPDPVHLTHCILNHRVLVSSDHHDFELLHDLVMQSGGNHPGIFAIRKDNSRRDMLASQIEKAIRRLTATVIVVSGQFFILNHWR
jgi:predicted nuclease of predicted toxin-antitoxin system